MQKVHPVAWFKKQPLPLKVGLVALALVLVGKLMESRSAMAQLYKKTPGETR